jgi:hypothetical protein
LNSASGDEISWMRATLTWMFIMLGETAHGVIREIFIAPSIGALRARQWGVLIGSLLVLGIACAASAWMRATTRRSQLIIGIYWVLLTVVFELLLGRAMGVSWPRILSDYNPVQGGFMLLGLGVMLAAPWLVARWLARLRR